MSSVATLNYADLPARWGISTERTGSSLRVTIKPVLGWRPYFERYRKAIIWTLALSAYMALPPVVEWARSGGTFLWPHLVAAFGIAIPILLGIVVMIQHHARKTVVITITQKALVCAQRWPEGQGSK